MSFPILLIVFLILLQLYVFIVVWKKITRFKFFFPKSFKEVTISKFLIPKAVLNDPQSFNNYIENLSAINKVDIADETLEQVELLVLPGETKKDHKDFNEVIKSTNAYLSKNKGASADFNILQDICERHLQKVDNEIGNLINVPLYIGLAGTFVGIIIGLLGIDFSATTEGTTTTISSESISHLLNGVTFAMVASLVGLIFSVVNSALGYKPAVFQNDTDKNHYYDFIQRELLPYLNEGVAGTLGSFRDVLNQFIKKFGDNMDDYKESGQLLNDNLQKQQFVLEEINKLSITRTATKIAEVFAGLKKSSEHLEKFQIYQESLNEQVEKTTKVTSDISTVIGQFKDFNFNLKAITNGSLATLELQKQFKDSLEKHFPTIEDHREIWRRQIDELNLDIKDVYQQLSGYFKTSTEEIQTFIGANNNFFSGIEEIQKAINLFVLNSSLQKEEFTIIKDEMINLRNDFKESQKQSIDTNKALIDALIGLNITLSKLESPVQN